MVTVTPRTPDPNLWAVKCTLKAAGDQSTTVSNTFTFRWTGSAGTAPGDWDFLLHTVTNFYNGPTSAMQVYLGKQISTAANAHEAALYNIDPTNVHHYFGSPVDVLPFTTASIGTNGPMPNEACITLSFRAGYGSDPEHEGNTRPRASDRGRIYFGPLDSSAVSAVATPAGTQNTVVNPSFITRAIGAMQALYTALKTSNWLWTVWSRKEQLFKAVVDWAINNDPDTQRRRSSGQGLQLWTPFT